MRLRVGVGGCGGLVFKCRLLPGPSSYRTIAFLVSQSTGENGRIPESKTCPVFAYNTQVLAAGARSPCGSDANSRSG